MSGNRSESAVLWGLVGCGGLLVLVLCGATGYGLYVVSQRGMPELPRFSTGSDAGTSDKPPIVIAPPVPPSDGKPPPGTGPIEIDVRVTAVTGALSGRVLGGCHVTVTTTADEQNNCRARAQCDGLTLYGEGSTGYFPCTLDPISRAVSGNDGATTSSDRDAAFMLDTNARVLRLRDDASGSFGEYTLEGTF